MKTNKNDYADKSFWFFLHAYTFVSIVGGEALLYNTLNGKYIIENKRAILEKIKGFADRTNKYVIELKGEDIGEEFSIFLKDVKGKFLGDYYEKSLSTRKPVQFFPKPMPELEYENNVPDSSKRSILSEDSIISYLNRLTIQVNNHCDQNCPMCLDGYKQFTCCHKSLQPSLIEPSVFKAFIRETENFFRLQQINITGGNIFHHPGFNMIVEELNRSNCDINYYISYKNLVPGYHDRQLESMTVKNNRIFLLVDLPDDKHIFNKYFKQLAKFRPFIHYSFIVQDDEHLDELEKLVADYNVENFGIFPYYNKENLAFFKENVFINRDFIDDRCIKMEEIKARMLVNPQKIKQLCISSAGDVFSSFNHTPLGKICQNKLTDMVRDAFRLQDSSWRQTRKDFKKCKGCIMKYLCPPISDYEYIIDCPSMCWKATTNEGNRF